MPEYKYVGDAGRVYPTLPAPANDPEPGKTYTLSSNPGDGRWEHKRPAKKAARKAASKKPAETPEPPAEPEPQPDTDAATADDTQE